MVVCQQLRYIPDATNYVLLQKDNRILQYLQFTFTNIINRKNGVYQRQHVICLFNPMLFNSEFLNGVTAILL